MPAGDIKITSIKVGNMDLTSTDKVSLAGFNVYEDILNPYGPVAEIRVVDPSDALGQNKVSGSYDQDVEIKFSGDDNIGSLGGGGSTLKLKMYQNKNLNDQSVTNTGSGHHKQYDIRAVSPELLNAQGNHVEKSFNGKTGDVVKHILEKGFKTKRQIEIASTKQRRIVIPKMHPLDAIKKMNGEHVSEKYESSCFALFQQADQGGEHKYVFKTFEELFEKQPVVKLKQTTNLNFSSANQQERQNSIIWFKPSDSFFTGSRALSKSSEHTIDLTTHKVVATNTNKSNKFKFADDSKIYEQAPSYANSVPIRYIHDKVNNKDKHQTSEAKTKRADFLAQLAQTSAELEVYYNPKITLGSVIELQIPKKANDNTEEGEKQWNGKCLVVAIRTKYRVAKEPPNCTMILRVVKGNSYKEGGGGNG
jgi:hypothetical protein